ncbi:MAG: FecR family protein [Methylococcaceae bacterium]|nr:FecR family protein [Methylococcaceae bacterium]
MMSMPDTQELSTEQQAIWWQARLSSDLLGDGQRREFDAWLAECPEHAAAWQAINSFWTGLDSLTLEDISDEAGGQVPEFPPAKSGRSPRSLFRPGLALAASLLLTLSFAYQQFDLYLADYRSATGLQRQIDLADGSSILLNTASAVSADFSAEKRLITLHSGEAFFKVAADRDRPFVVKTEAGEVRALGTAFDVRRQDDDVSVTVFEHAVKITTAGGEIKERLSEAEQLLFSRDRVNAVSHVNPQRAAAWHQQRMVFQDKPLAEVVAELDRYRPGKIIILDDAIKNLPITGVFGIADTDVALQSIEQSLAVKVRKVTDHLVLLSAK